jgi:hypothetical protein
MQCDCELYRVFLHVMEACQWTVISDAQELVTFGTLATEAHILS